MHVVATFQHTIKLEIALAELENGGIPRADILVLPLDRRPEDPRLFDTMHRSDGVSLIELAAVLGMIGMLLGAIYGFVLAWGPIIWATIGLAAGALIGYGINVLRVRRAKRRAPAERDLTDLVLLVRCPPWQADKVQRILWDGNALGLAVYAGPDAGAGTENEG